MYEKKDHLGNVRVVISDGKIAETDASGNILKLKVRVRDYTNYYAFGMAMPGRRMISSEGYRYGFNGKEKDSEWGGGAMYDYGFRIYDPRIAKFLSVDPLTASYPWYTPYQFAGNKPIFAVDLDGAEEWSWKDFQEATLKGVVYIHKVNEGFVKRGVDNVVGMVHAPRAAAQIMKIYADNNMLATNGDLSSVQIKLRLTALIFNSVWQDYKDLVIRAANGDPEAVGGVLFEVLSLVLEGDELAKLSKIKNTKLFRNIDISKTLATEQLHGVCFTAGTQIKVKDGHKNIEEIKVGDKVWSYNEKKEEFELKEVAKVFLKVTNELVRIKFNNEVVFVTPEHPFFIKGKWVSAIKINIDDSVSVFGGARLAVIEISKIDTSNVVVYNFEVETNHSYYVSILDILVHNSCSIDPHDIAKGVTKNFADKNFTCMDCADELVSTLSEQRIKGEILDLEIPSEVQQ